MTNKTILFCCLVAISYLTACKVPQEITKPIAEPTEEVAEVVKDTATIDSTLFIVDPTELGYAYGTIVSEQFTNIDLGFSQEEKNIDQVVLGFRQALKGDKKIYAASMAVLQKRISSQEKSPTTAAANQLAYHFGVNGMGLGELSQYADLPEGVLDFEAIKVGFLDNEIGRSKYSRESRDSLIQVFVSSYQAEYMTKKQAEQEAQAVDNIAAGKAFLAANAKKEGVVTLASGLQYKIIKKGTGKQPTINDKVKTHYHGTTIDGKVFDSSVDRGEPASFGVSQVIRGWQEGIPLMKEGAKYILYIPQELGYGMQSPSAAIPAGSTLIFEVELITVNPVD